MTRAPSTGPRPRRRAAGPPSSRRKPLPGSVRDADPGEARGQTRRSHPLLRRARRATRRADDLARSVGQPRPRRAAGLRTATTPRRDGFALAVCGFCSHRRVGLVGLRCGAGSWASPAPCHSRRPRAARIDLVWSGNVRRWLLRRRFIRLGRAWADRPGTVGGGPVIGPVTGPSLGRSADRSAVGVRVGELAPPSPPSPPQATTNASRSSTTGTCRVGPGVRPPIHAIAHLLPSRRSIGR